MITSGDSEVAASVIRESEQESEDAKKFLEDVRVTFPQVLRVVKTRQVTYSVLNHLIDYVHNLEKIGLLEEKEMSHLHDAVQTDLKKLLRNPPSVKIPKVHNLINTNPLLGALPPRVRETLAGSTKEIMKLQGATLYKEGSKPTGIWLISNGVVKWSSKSISNKPLLHPTFSHGSTLGLYEVLSQRPYICDIITDSVVIGFFIETEKILSALRSDPAVEDFFWRESIIVIAKVMLPQMFEKMSMQDLRALIVERSMMNIYIRGESFELFHRYVGFVLEGFIKLQDAEQEEMLTAPAAILPHVDQTIRRSGTLVARAGSFSQKGSWYQVETRARVITFDMAGFEGGRTLLKKSSSRISHPDLPSESLARKHSDLMSWPEHYFKSGRDGEVHAQQRNSLSSRAMQLSIFGSMINIRKQQTQSFHQRESNPSHSLSYPIIVSAHGRPIASAKSEGSNTLRTRLDQMQQNKQEKNAAQPKELRNEGHRVTRDENSSDDSGCEDEHIVRIDTPSRLSFRQDS